MCDDVKAFVSEMSRHNIDCAAVQDQGYGLVTSVTLPGGGKLGVYQPRHARRPAPRRRLGSRTQAAADEAGCVDRSPHAVRLAPAPFSVRRQYSSKVSPFCFGNTLIALTSQRGGSRGFHCGRIEPMSVSALSADEHAEEGAGRCRATP